MAAPKPKKGMVKRGAWEVTKKLLKAIPIVGPVFVVGFAGYDIKKKGLVPGAVHVGLDVTPVVGTAKNVLEIFTGDLIPDKPPRTTEQKQGIAETLSSPAGNTESKPNLNR
ncbi:MAG TPA: hypothetical protein VIT88_07105 [Pyrinomonadaceae bacterium]